MTIIYQYRVATTSLGGFLKLLKAWKGSVYKLLYKELLIFVFFYALISIIYRFALTEDQRTIFEGLVLELYGSTSAIPLSFLLGFYVTFIAQRWWQQFTNVPWPDRCPSPYRQIFSDFRDSMSLCCSISAFRTGITVTLYTMTAYLHGFDDRARMMRRSVARYMLFGLIWICRAISVAVMKRFPTLDHIVEAGFITKEEKIIFESVECKYQKFFVPMMWANQILVTARREGKIDTDFGLRMILQPLADFRDRLSLCFVYDWITVPLVYTQETLQYFAMGVYLVIRNWVVTFATYSYFVISIFGQQYLDPSKNYKGFEQDFYIPGISILQFLFYMGWLKVAEQMINPFGEDDDDFDINWLLDRHTGVAFALVDVCYGKHPDMVRDGFWNDVTPDVPYTESSAGSIRPNFVGSTFNIEPPILHDHERMLFAERQNINQHEWTSRARGKSFMSDSLLSLLHIRSSHPHTSGESRSSLSSNGSGGQHMSNGKAYDVADKENGSQGMIRRSSVDVPVTGKSSEDDDDGNNQLREHLSPDSEFRRSSTNPRKMSLPFSINLFKSRQKRSESLGSPKATRFVIEPIKEENSRRPGHPGIAHQSVVSRIPVLSAIEEGSTVTSIKQLVEQQGDENSNQDFDENHESGVLSDDDDKAYEDCISYVDESNSVLSEFSNKATSTAATSSPLFSKRVMSTITAQAKPAAHCMPTSKDTETVFIDSTPLTQPTQSPSNGNTIFNMNTSKQGSLLPYLIPVSEAKIEVMTFPTNGQTFSKDLAKTKEELAPLICIEEC